MPPDLAQHFARLFRRHFDAEPVSVTPVAADSSRRRMRRLLGPAGERAVGVWGPEREENRAFLSFTETFRELGLAVPEIYTADEESGAWLEEDLGDLTLFDAIEQARRAEGAAWPSRLGSLYRRVLEQLTRFQVEGGRAIDFSVAFPRPAFDAQAMRWDLSYFKYHFLMLAHVPFHEDRLERDFERLTAFLLEAESEYFVYRDFQSRNIMVREEEPAFLDYQGGRKGSLQYDVAALLYDAKAGVPKAVKAELLAHYLDVLGQRIPVDRARFEQHFRGYVLLRTLQAMGTYGYRGFYERRPRFLRSIAPRVADIEAFLEDGFVALDLPELRSALERMCAMEELRAPTRPYTEGLTVHVGSFSYRGGYPAHESEHGGGFVFDCRAQVNPGRDAAYERLSGRDPEVVRYMEGNADTHAFFDAVSRLVDAQVQTYVARGFTSLDVHFGCTGGQHRSVYFAERLTAHLRRAFPDVGVTVRHAEETRWRRETP